MHCSRIDSFLRGAALTLTLVAVACGPVIPDGPSATSLQRDALMAAAFPSWKLASPQVFTQLDLPVKDKASQPTVARAIVKAQLDIKPEHVIRLDDDRAVLITSASYSGKDKQPDAAHTPGVLGAYWFKRIADHWYPDGAHVVAETGDAGQVGTVSVIKLAYDRFAIAVENGSCGIRSCGSWLELYGVERNAVPTLLAERIPLSSETRSANGNCDDLLKLAPGTPVLQKAVSKHEDCYNVSGKWHITPGKTTPGDLVLDFVNNREVGHERVVEPEGASTANGDETITVETKHRVTTSQVVYRFCDGRYACVSGKNPIPKI